MKDMEYETKEFAIKVMEEYRQINSDAKIFINIGERRTVRRSITNDYIDITVLNEQEKQFIENMFSRRVLKDVQQKPQRQQESPKRVGKMIKDLNTKEISTRDAIRTVKSQNKKTKRTLKNRVKKLVKKVYKMLPKTKEEIKQFLKETGMKIGIGIMALAAMGIITSESLANRAENINTYNEEFTSIEQVEKEIKGIIDAEIKEAIDNSEVKPAENLSIDINRIEPYRDENAEGVEIIINGVGVNYDKKMVLREEIFYGGNIPESLEEMADSYLKVQEMRDSNMTNGKKSKAIKLLKKVQKIAERRDLKIRKSFIPDILNSGNKYVIREIQERKDVSEGIER